MRFLIFLLTLALPTLAIPLRQAFSADEQPAAAATSTAAWKHVQKLLKQNCYDCHEGEQAEGDADLSQFASGASLRDARPLWRKVRELVAFGAMPPEDADQLTKAQRASFVASLDEILGESGGCDLSAKPVPVTVRRLNRQEYNNTIRDLLGIDLRPADTFPSDEVGDGFDNNSNVMTLPPLLLERYLTAAEDCANTAITTPQELKERELHQTLAGDLLHPAGPVKQDSFVRHQLIPGGSVEGTFNIPVAGRYRISVTLYSEDTSGFDKPLILSSDFGKSLAEFQVESSKTTRFREDWDLPAGTVRLKLELPADAKPIADNKQDNEKENKEQKEKPEKTDRTKPAMVSVSNLQVDGPQKWTEEMYPESHRRIVLAKPDKNLAAQDAAKKVLKPFAKRAFRSSVRDTDLLPYLHLFNEAISRKLPYERALEISMSAILVSPRFLYRIETLPEPPVGQEISASTPPLLSAYELANRLSYFLWSSMPDETLFQLAASGEILESTTLAVQTQRMIQDPKADALFEGFAAQWLGLRNLGTTTPNTDSYPGFSDELRRDMLEESRLVFLDHLRGAQSVLDLLDGQRTFLNQRLAEHYGIKKITGEQFRAVSLQDTQRRGILSHASILTLTSNPGRTSPVKRGKWVMENVLGTPPPEPPANVLSLEESAKDVSHLPIRDQLEIHRADPACAACHRYMDAIGFGLENFDGIGKWRTEDQGLPLDTSGELPSGDTFSGPLELAQKIRASEGKAFVRVVADRLLTYALGRGLTAADQCILDEILTDSQAANHSLQSMITAVVLSSRFRQHVPSP